jgi:signal transduction histidine kinase
LAVLKETYARLHLHRDWTSPPVSPVLFRLVHASADAESDDRARLLLEQALAGVQAGLGELRELPHGIYPAILTEAGLGPALATLADSAAIRSNSTTPSRAATRR